MTDAPAYDDPEDTRGRMERVRGRDNPAGREVWSCPCGRPFASAVLRGHHAGHCKVKKAIHAWEAEQIVASVERARARRAGK